MLPDLVVEPVGYLLAARHVGAARVRRDREPGRNGNAERRHLREADALAAEELAAAGGLLVEVVDVTHAVILAQAARAPKLLRRHAVSTTLATTGSACEDADMRGHIVAMGGGGFLGGDLTSPLDDLLLELAGVPKPHVVFLPTATGDADPGRRGLRRTRGVRETARRTWPSPSAIPDRPAERVAAADVVVVAGGNTANMLAVWRLHGIDAALRRRWERGAVLGGVSAGANCWFEACVTDSFSIELDGLDDGLGLLAGSYCPHFDGEERRRPVYGRPARRRIPRRDRLRRRSGGRLPRHRARRDRRRPARRARLSRHGVPARAHRDPPAAMRKVAVTASASGSGKTTVGRELARDSASRSSSSMRSSTARTGSRRPTTSSAACWSRSSRRRLGDRRRLPREDRRPRPPQADTVVWLDLPLRVWLPRLIRRTVRRLRGREELWNGNRETLTDAIWGGTR